MDDVKSAEKGLGDVGVGVHHHKKHSGASVLVFNADAIVSATSDVFLSFFEKTVLERFVVISKLGLVQFCKGFCIVVAVDVAPRFAKTCKDRTKFFCGTEIVV